MTHIPIFVEAAAFEAHMAAADQIAKALRIDRGAPVDVAHALAHAYGEALAIYAMTGAASDQLEALDRIAQRAFQGMTRKIQDGAGGNAA
jgi:hypothetical protein